MYIYTYMCVYIQCTRSLINGESDDDSRKGGGGGGGERKDGLVRGRTIMMMMRWC